MTENKSTWAYPNGQAPEGIDPISGLPLLCIFGGQCEGVTPQSQGPGVVPGAPGFTPPSSTPPASLPPGFTPNFGSGGQPPTPPGNLPSPNRGTGGSVGGRTGITPFGSGLSGGGVGTGISPSYEDIVKSIVERSAF